MCRDAHVLCRQEWKHSLLVPDKLCPASVLLPLLLRNSVLMKDALILNNFNGVSCCSFRGATSQRHWLLPALSLSLSKWTLHPNPRELPVWVQQRIPAGPPWGMHWYVMNHWAGTERLLQLCPWLDRFSMAAVTDCLKLSGFKSAQIYYLMFL